MTKPAHLLARDSHRRGRSGASMLPFLGDLTLAAGRVHEFCGPARRTAAIMLAARLAAYPPSPVIWISAGWGGDRLAGTGLARHLDPARMIFVAPKTPVDILWSAEQALRGSCARLVVIEVAEAPSMTAVRRLHLAAEGDEDLGITETAPPLGLILSPGDGGAPGIETRWHMAPAHGQDALPGPAPDGHGRDIRFGVPAPAWHLSRRRARALPPRSWTVTPLAADTATRPVQQRSAAMGSAQAAPERVGWAETGYQLTPLNTQLTEV